jgi:hypothetical protein
MSNMEWRSFEWLPAGGFPASSPCDDNGWAWAFRSRGPVEDIQSAGSSNVTGQRSEKLARLEAVLFVADGALSIRKMVQAATLADNAEARRLLDELNAIYDDALARIIHRELKYRDNSFVVTGLREIAKTQCVNQPARASVRFDLESQKPWASAQRLMNNPG